MIKQTLRIALPCVLAWAWPQAASAYQVQACDATAERDIRLAADWIGRRLSTIVSRYYFLTSDSRQEILRKWPGLDIRCSDNVAQCSRFSGYAHGGLGNQVNLCYYRANPPPRLCDLVEIIMHEQGHAHGFRMLSGHNTPTKNHLANDPIYLMGSSARALCLKDPDFDDAPLQGRSNRPLAAACSADMQCSSTRCEQDQCVCREDGDCPAGQSCRRPALAANRCE